MSEKAAEEQHALDDWSTKQLLTLIERVEHYAQAIGRRSVLGLRCTVVARKLDWQAIKFEDFSADVCRAQWEHVLAKVGKIRTTKELLDSAVEWLKMPIQKRGHAGLPKKPLTPYLLFSKAEAEKVKEKHPSWSMIKIARKVASRYKHLTDEERASLEKKHQQEMAVYEEQLQQFYLMHPEQKPVQKPYRPCRLFVDSRLKKELQQNDQADVGELRKRFTAEWHTLSDKKKTRWVVKATKQRDKYLAANPNLSDSKRFLTGKEQDLLAAHQGKPLRPPASILRYYMSTAAAAAKAAEGKATDGEDHALGIRDYAAMWKDLTRLEQVEHWRGYYQAVTAYQAAMQEWLSGQDNAVPESQAAEERKYDEAVAELFAREDELCAKHGYTIRGPCGLIDFEQQRSHRLAAKYPDEAAKPGGLRRLALDAYQQISDDRKRKYEDAEVARLSNLRPASSGSKRKLPSASGRKAASSKRAKLLDNGVDDTRVDGIKLPPEPRKPPRSSYHTFLAHEMASTADSNCAEDETESTDGDGRPATSSAQKKSLAYLNRRWAQLSKEEKERWEERCRAEKQHYQARLEAYKKGLTTEQLEAYERRLAMQAALHRRQLEAAKRARRESKSAAEDITVYFPPVADGKSLLGGDAAGKPSGRPEGLAKAGSRSDQPESEPEMDSGADQHQSEPEIDDSAVGYFDSDKSADGSDCDPSAGRAAGPVGASSRHNAAPAVAAVGRGSPRKVSSLTQFSVNTAVPAVRQSPAKANVQAPVAGSMGDRSGAAAPAAASAAYSAALLSPRKDRAAPTLPADGGAATKSPRKAAVPGDSGRAITAEQQPHQQPSLDPGDDTEPDEQLETAPTTVSQKDIARHEPAAATSTSAATISRGKGVRSTADDAVSGLQKATVSRSRTTGLKQPKGPQKAKGEDS